MNVAKEMIMRRKDRDISRTITNLLGLTLIMLAGLEFLLFINYFQ